MCDYGSVISSEFYMDSDGTDVANVFGVEVAEQLRCIPEQSMELVEHYGEASLSIFEYDALVEEIGKSELKRVCRVFLVGKNGGVRVTLEKRPGCFFSPVWRLDGDESDSGDECEGRFVRDGSAGPATLVSAAVPASVTAVVGGPLPSNAVEDGEKFARLDQAFREATQGRLEENLQGEKAAAVAVRFPQGREFDDPVSLLLELRSQGKGREEIVGMAGYCYASIFGGRHFEVVVKTLGRYPRLEDLLRIGTAFLLDDDVLCRTDVRGSTRECLHLSVVTGACDPGYTLAAVLPYAALSASPPGSIGWRLKTYRDQGVAPAELQLATSVVAGAGDFSGGGESAEGGGPAYTSLVAYTVSVCERFGGAVPLSRTFVSDLGIVQRTAAMHSATGKSRLGVLEAVGDAVITRFVARVALATGVGAQGYQEARSAVTSNAALADVFGRKFRPEWFSVPAGMQFQGRTSAKLVESFVGVLDVHDSSMADHYLCYLLGAELRSVGLDVLRLRVVPYTYVPVCDEDVVPSV